MATGFLAAIGLIPNALIAPPGTRLLFNNSAVPLGWTQDVSAAFNDTSVRTVTSSGGGTAGATAWSQWNFGATFNVNTFTISTGQMPTHTHGINDSGHSHVINIFDPGHAHSVNDPSHAHVPSGGASGFVTVGNGSGNTNAGSTIGSVAATANATTGISINGSGTGISANSNASLTGISTQSTGSGGGITPNYTTPQVKYSDYIIGIKS